VEVKEKNRSRNDTRQGKWLCNERSSAEQGFVTREFTSTRFA